MYTKKNYAKLKGMEGFSNKALDIHFALYEGYVNNVNKIGTTLFDLMKQDKAATPEYGELKRRWGWEFNGMRLHELYFENLTNGDSKMQGDSALAKKIVGKFDSYENWEKNFRATGALRGIGWVILYYDQRGEEFFNVWINEHDSGHFAGAVPLLVMDVFEHAFFVDYGKDRAAYIDAFMKNINWEEVEKRLM
jgi:Fe-Mn family superoxide dismutase